jgi:S-adenosylmethionine synthetase
MPIDHPQMASANVIYAPNVDKSKYEKEARAVFDEQLANIYKLTDEIVSGKLTVF